MNTFCSYCSALPTSEHGVLLENQADREEVSERSRRLEERLRLTTTWKWENIY